MRFDSKRGSLKRGRLEMGKLERALRVLQGKFGVRGHLLRAGNMKKGRHRARQYPRIVQGC